MRNRTQQNVPQLDKTTTKDVMQRGCILWWLKMYFSWLISLPITVGQGGRETEEEFYLKESHLTGLESIKLSARNPNRLTKPSSILFTQLGWIPGSTRHSSEQSTLPALLWAGGRTGCPPEVPSNLSKATIPFRELETQLFFNSEAACPPAVLSSCRYAQHIKRFKSVTFSSNLCHEVRAAFIPTKNPCSFWALMAESS